LRGQELAFAIEHNKHGQTVLNRVAVAFVEVGISFGSVARVDIDHHDHEVAVELRDQRGVIGLWIVDIFTHFRILCGEYASSDQQAGKEGNNCLCGGSVGIPPTELSELS